VRLLSIRVSGSWDVTPVASYKWRSAE